MTTNDHLCDVLVAVLGIIVVKCIKQSNTFIKLRKSDCTSFFNMEGDFRILCIRLLKVSVWSISKQNIFKGYEVPPDIPSHCFNLDPRIRILINHKINNGSISISLEILNCNLDISPIGCNKHQEITVRKVLINNILVLLTKCIFLYFICYQYRITLICRYFHVHFIFYTSWCLDNIQVRKCLSACVLKQAGLAWAVEARIWTWKLYGAIRVFLVLVN